MSDNLPKELRVNPVSIDDVKTLIKEAMANSPKPSSDIEFVKESELDNLTSDEVITFLKKLYRGEIIIYDDLDKFVVGYLTALGIRQIFNNEVEINNQYPAAISYNYDYDNANFQIGMHLFVLAGSETGYKIDVSD